MGSTLATHSDSGLIVTNYAKVIEVLGKPLNPILFLADALNANSRLRIDPDHARATIARTESLNSVIICRASVSNDTGNPWTI